MSPRLKALISQLLVHSARYHAKRYPGTLKTGYQLRKACCGRDRRRRLRAIVLQQPAGVDGHYMTWMYSEDKMVCTTEASMLIFVSFFVMAGGGGLDGMFRLEKLQIKESVDYVSSQARTVKIILKMNR
eukprot:TRINITY_DN3442_c0_g2_i1.p2 TRINITY_DN3442_c0_g2~~TRINITY_DN3442_c0_g2_i1.p2  ORF type:complete len:129 (+),score=3.09 TRINITY_DN3442_c0_g2_i1:624-1010(+)